MANWNKMQNLHWISWKIAPKASNMPSQDVWKFTRVLKDIGPLGPLPCSDSTLTPSRASGTADHVQSLDDFLLNVSYFFYLKHPNGLSDLAALSLWVIPRLCAFIFVYRFPIPKWRVNGRVNGWTRRKKHGKTKSLLGNAELDKKKGCLLDGTPHLFESPCLSIRSSFFSVHVQKC